MIRTFGLGSLAQKGVFWASGNGPSAENVGKSQGRVNTCVGQNDRFRCFFAVRGWPYRAKIGDCVLTVFPMFPAFCVFSHALFILTVFLTFLIHFPIFSSKKKHNTTHIQNTTHTHSIQYPQYTARHITSHHITFCTCLGLP